MMTDAPTLPAHKYKYKIYTKGYTITNTNEIQILTPNRYTQRDNIYPQNDDRCSDSTCS